MGSDGQRHLPAVESGNALLRVHRSRQRPWYGLQSLRVELDGQVVARLKGGVTMTFQVAPGPHQLRVGFRVWVWSYQLLFTLSPNGEFSVECGNDRWGYPWIEARRDT